MNVDKDNLEPHTDLGLTVNYSNHCIQRRLNNHLGAGANAGSSRGMTFVTTDPLSELVWSPQKGPSLKCADCSFSDKKSSLLWDAGPSNVVFSSAPPMISAVRCSNDKLMNENNNMIKSHMGFYVKSDVGDRHTSARCPTNNAAIKPVSGPSPEQKTGTGGHMEETSTILQLSVQHANKNDDLSRPKGEVTCDLNTIQADEAAEAIEDNLKNFLDVLKPNVAQTEPLFENPAGGYCDANSENQTSKIEINLMSDIHAKNKTEACDDALKSQTVPPKRREEPASFTEGENDRKIKSTDSSNIRCMEKLESTAENDLQIHIGENGCDAASKSVATEFAHEGKRCSQQEKARFREKLASGKYSAKNSGIQKYERKGKEKALSDGNLSMMSKEADDSYESVESCNGTGLFSTGKRRWNFEQQMIAGSKRAKMQIRETLESTSFVKQDSSFVNWIGNMMKGFLKLKEDEAPSVSLTLAYPTNGGPDHDTIATTRNKNPGCRTVGFQSIFQSIYCPQRRIQDVTTSNDKCHKEVELPNDIFNPNPVNCHGNFTKQFTISDERNTESTFGNGVLLETQPKISSVNFAASQENKNTNSSENKWLCNLHNSKGKEGTSSSSSLGKYKLNIAENIDSEPPSEGESGQNFGNGSDHLGSLWIARLAPKTSGFSLNLNQQNRSTDVDLEYSADCAKLPHSPQYHVSSPSEAKIVEARQHSLDDQKIAIGNDLPKCAGETECKITCNSAKDHNDHKSTYNMNPILSSPIENSEAMASLFARRLDTLRHIMPSDLVENTASATVSCFFCGRKGHHLRDCPEMTDEDLEDLLRTVNKYNGTEEFSSFCVRCFRLNHWAVTCPNASSKGNRQRECGASLAGEFSPSSGKHNSRIEENPKFLNGNDSQFQVAEVHSLLDRNDSGIRASLKLNSTEKLVASSSGKNKLRGNEIVPLSKYITRESSDVPKGIFDAVRMLRLSRTDILKWMNSQMAGSHLDGCFLRLRVGKWEKGLGGTGYYVACITEAQRQSSPQSSKNSIFVVVRGIRCLVESQYISNHDFLEDELNVWWFTIEKNGGTIPMEEVLRLKVKERRTLGF